MHHGEATALRSLTRTDSRAQVHERDGHEALLALIPPKEKRGIVLIDPPYEDPVEFTRLEATILAACHRWSTGIFAVWYPIKQGDAALRFVTRMAASGLRRQLLIELTHEQDDLPGGLNGSGLLVINPPYQFDQAMRNCLPWLHRHLSHEGRGRNRVIWSVPE
jgi:23S rRNA (adenine2030-N6)-methyltransferase